MDGWVERELDGCEFPDQRLKARLGKLLGDLGRRSGGTVPAACQDWAATKAASHPDENFPDCKRERLGLRADPGPPLQESGPNPSR